MKNSLVSPVQSKRPHPWSGRSLLIGGLLVGTVAATAGDLLPYHRRARVRCSLPAWPGYVTQQASPPVRTETNTVLWLELTDPPANSTLNAPVPERRIRVYQGGSPLVVEHCSIGRVALAIDETGLWTVSLAAEQFPYIVNGNDRQATPAARFLRNEFHIRFRGVALAQTEDPQRVAPVGQPEMFNVALQPFWMARDSRERISQRGRLTAEELARLPLVDRVEVELRIK